MGEVVKPVYQYTVRAGDIVRLPNGEVGTVKFVNRYKMAGEFSDCYIMVFVEPDVVWYKRWWMHFTSQVWFCDQEINKLVLLAREEKKERR